jgi:hypothetical protein
MFRIGLVALALGAACPAAMAQESEAEGRILADAFTATDLETLGGCQARVEGLALLVTEFAGWLEAEGHTKQLQGLRAGMQASQDLSQRMADLRAGVAEMTEASLTASDASYEKMLATFQRRSGEDDAAAYARWQPETLLPQDCRVAMKRARWKLELDGWGN